MVATMNDLTRAWCASVLEGGGFMDALPDPMKLDGGQILFVMGVVTVLYLVLKAMFFRPVLATIDARDQAIEGGAARRAEVADMVAQRQGAYEARLKELRGQAFERRKALTDAAIAERQRLVVEARDGAAADRAAAMERLSAQALDAKQDLLRQVDALADTMVAHLLKV